MSVSSLLEHVPALIRSGCSVLIFATIGCLLWMLWTGWTVKFNLTRLLRLLAGEGASPGERARSGIPLEQLDLIRSGFENRRDLPARWWRRIDERIEPYISPEGQEGYFAAEPLREVLPFESVVGDGYNGSFWRTIPGLLTGAGLALTFTAILLALNEVHYDRANTVNPITGIDALINGLSGKFLSSIVALLLSIVFILIERGWNRSIRNSYEISMGRIACVIPHLTMTRILLDIHTDARKQTVSLSNLSSELVDRLTNTLNRDVVPGLSAGMSSSVALSLHEQFQPTMQNMAASLNDLRSAIIQLEAQKGESVTGEFGRMAQSLEAAVTTALNRMGEQFHGALMGTAKDEFGQAQDSMETTRLLLEQMAVQFAGMQTAFSMIASNAQQATADQLRSGKEQTEALTAVMHGLMKQLQENADQNLTTMQSQLTRVVTDLSTKVTDLSQQFLQTSSAVAERSEKSVSQVIEQTETWTQASALRLQKLMDAIEARSADFNEASKALLEAKVFLNNLLAQNAQALAQMAAASSDVKTYSTALVGHTAGMKEITTNHLAVSDRLKTIATELRDASAQHERLLGDYDQAIKQFTQVFHTLDDSIAKIMAATSRGLSDYNQSVEKNFDSIVDVASKLVPEAANLLNTQIEELQGQLEELGQVITKSVESLRGRRV